MHLDPFELHRPTSVEEAVGLAARLTPAGFDYLAGGTDLLPNYKMHLNLKPHLVALWDVAELTDHNALRIGAMTRLADLEADAGFSAAFPGVAESVREVATPLVRASATVAGNLLVETRCFFFNQSLPWRESLGYCLKADGDRCHVVPQKERCYATFSGDLAPSLLALDASAVIAGPGGRRTMPLSGLYDRQGDGIRRHHLAAGELLVAVVLPEDAAGTPATYRKLRIRPSFDFPELGVAVALRMDGSKVGSLRIALGGLETYPRRLDELTGPLVGETLTTDRIRDLGAAAARAVRPVHNTFLDPAYRKKMTGVFVRRAVAALVGAAGVVA